MEKKICMVVDDSGVVRKVSRRILEALSYEVVEAENGQKALEVAEASNPSLILLDWNMPVMSGIEFLREFRKKKDIMTVKVIFCTTENDITKIMMAMEAGANEYIMKPFDEEIIKTKLTQMGLL
jgi:two-component system, chemotaxis family, chemotaxis protein CheY